MSLADAITVNRHMGPGDFGTTVAAELCAFITYGSDMSAKITTASEK